jgi:hypothetical protein
MPCFEGERTAIKPEQSVYDAILALATERRKTSVDLHPKAIPAFRWNPTQRVELGRQVGGPSD